MGGGGALSTVVSTLENLPAGKIADASAEYSLFARTLFLGFFFPYFWTTELIIIQLPVRRRSSRKFSPLS
jgi:hypothetical protein